MKGQNLDGSHHDQSGEGSILHGCFHGNDSRKQQKVALVPFCYK